MTKLKKSLFALGLAAATVAPAYAGELCWNLDDTDYSGTGVLQLSTLDMGTGITAVAGTITITIPDITPPVVVTQVVYGDMGISGTGKREISLQGSDMNRTRTNPNSKIWSLNYHMELDPTTMTGTMRGTMLNHDGKEVVYEYRNIESVQPITCPAV